MSNMTSFQDKQLPPLPVTIFLKISRVVFGNMFSTVAHIKSILGFDSNTRVSVNYRYKGVSFNKHFRPNFKQLRGTYRMLFSLFCGHCHKISKYGSGCFVRSFTSPECWKSFTYIVL